MYLDQAPVHYPRPSPRHQRHASSRQYRDQLGHQPLHVARTAREPAVVTSRTAREPAVVTQPRWTGSSDDRKDYDKPVAAAGFAICLGCLLVIGGVWCGIASLTFAGEFLQRWVVIYHWWKLRSNVTSIGHNSAFCWGGKSRLHLHFRRAEGVNETRTLGKDTRKQTYSLFKLELLLLTETCFMNFAALVLFLSFETHFNGICMRAWKARAKISSRYTLWTKTTHDVQVFRR